MLWVVVLRVLFFVDRGCPVFSVADLDSLKLFLRQADADRRDTCVIIDYLTV